MSKVTINRVIGLCLIAASIIAECIWLGINLADVVRDLAPALIILGFAVVTTCGLILIVQGEWPWK